MIESTWSMLPVVAVGKREGDKDFENLGKSEKILALSLKI